ncbi:MAG: hypothetical protein J5680_03010 [Neisseriaceae bacterium]|nr:hypothetical protein [Neisseriaceae bacterium]
MVRLTVLVYTVCGSPPCILLNFTDYTYDKNWVATPCFARLATVIFISDKSLMTINRFRQPETCIMLFYFLFKNQYAFDCHF